MSCIYNQWWHSFSKYLQVWNFLCRKLLEVFVRCFVSRISPDIGIFINFTRTIICWWIFSPKNSISASTEGWCLRTLHFIFLLWKYWREVAKIQRQDPSFSGVNYNLQTPTWRRWIRRYQQWLSDTDNLTNEFDL